MKTTHTKKIGRLVHKTQVRSQPLISQVIGTERAEGIGSSQMTQGLIEKIKRGSSGIVLIYQQIGLGYGIVRIKYYLSNMNC